MLEAALEILAVRTDLVARKGNKYTLTRRYDAHARIAVRQYLGAYGRNGIELRRILLDPSLAAGLIDRDEHARAFDETATLPA